MQSGAGVPYVSKLEALQEFAARAKMSGLRLHASAPESSLASQPSNAKHPSSQVFSRLPADGGSQQVGRGSLQTDEKCRPPQRLILMDDMPHAHDAPQRAALLEAISECPCLRADLPASASVTGSSLIEHPANRNISARSSPHCVTCAHDPPEGHEDSRSASPSSNAPATSLVCWLQQAECRACAFATPCLSSSLMSHGVTCICFRMKVTEQAVHVCHKHLNAVMHVVCYQAFASIFHASSSDKHPSHWFPTWEAIS